MLRAMRQGWWLCWMVLVSWQAHGQTDARAEPLTARVLRVVDGDSLWVRVAQGPPLRLRLQGVDAPEICQAHGPQAREALERRLMGRTVQVRLLRKDSYDRWLARVNDKDGNKEGDVAAWMVSRGHAWSARWQRQPGPYAEQEQAARQARRGLFAQRAPEEPRAFRLRHGPCGVGASTGSNASPGP